MKMNDISWIEWYDKLVKGKSKNIKEELRKCKEMLRLFWYITPQILNKPWFMEQLLEEFESTGIVKGQVEEALNRLTNLTFIFPLRNSIELYIEWNRNIDLEKIEDAFFAITWILTPDLSTKDWEKIMALFDKRKSGKIPDEKIYSEMKNLKVLEKIRLCKLGLKILPFHLIISERMMEGAASLALFGNFAAAVLLRPAIEAFLRGAILEHLLRYRFREDVKLMLRSGKRLDTVTLFLREATTLSKDLKVPLDTIIGAPKFLSIIYNNMAKCRIAKNLSINDMLY